MVSVVVPVYNVEPYLAECVESIYAQTFGDYELLLIDDASTDDSGRLAEPHWHLVEQDAMLTPDKKGRIEAVMAGRLPNMAYGKLIARELFVAAGLQFEPILSEDTLFAFELLERAGIYVLIPAVSYCYRQSPTSTLHGKSLVKSRKAMESTLAALTCLERDLRSMPELRDDPVLCHRVRQWFAAVYLRWLWLRVSEGLDGNAVLAEAEQVFLEKAPEQAALLSLLLESWTRMFVKTDA